MDLQWSNEGSEARFSAYVEALARCLGHKDRVEPFRRYCVGLLLPGERKSVEPMAARLRPERTAAEHQSLLHFVGQSPWDERVLLRAVREAVLPAMTARSPVTAWILDDTGFPKKGPHSVGVARQYCGELGKQDNCQVAVSLSVASAEASLPIAWQLYLPEAWANDPERRAAAKVPPEVAFATKPEIALAQIRAALEEGVPPGVVLADAGYGNNSAFRDAIAELGLDYVVGVLGNIVVWPPGTKPEVPAWSGRGRRATRLRRGGDNADVVQVRTLAARLPDATWRSVHWRAGVAEELCSRFAAVRVRPGRRPPQRGPRRTLAARRVAARRRGGDQVLAVDPARGDPDRPPRAPGQAALADRARLSGAQAGTRPGSLRRPRLARFPPPCRLMHRRLRVSGRRTGGLSPLGRRRRQAGPGGCRSQPSATPRLPRCVQSGTCRTRSRHCEDASRTRLLNCCPDVRAAIDQCHRQSNLLCDAVRLD